jgi:phosphotransferase system enzyme I (PtsI)
VAERLHGIAASPGIAIGPALVHSAELPEIHTRRVDDVEAEVVRLESAVEATSRRLKELEARAHEGAGSEVAMIFEAHQMFLEDPSFSGEALEIVGRDRICAEAAVTQVTDRLATEFEDLGDEYFAARASDLRDIGSQLVRQLLGIGDAGFMHLTEPVVIVANDLTPSETVTIPPGMALAFVTEIGSPTSHTAILARSLGIPAVVGVGSAELTTGDMVAVDGHGGTVWIDPDEATLHSLRGRRTAEAQARAQAEAHAHEPARSTDGVQIEVVANIGTAADAERADQAGAEGVGLFRTEFLFIDRGSPPTESEQYETYRRVFEVFGERPVVVRTLDVGGDKNVPGIELGDEMNPFLGKRGIRLTLDEPDLFRTQLKALLRAAVGANLKLMFPMVASLSEIEATRAAVDAAKRELDESGVERAHSFEIGIMIEVPSAAVTADLLAPHVDFFSIGTNDLTQYTLAVDRTNPSVALMADALHPAVLRLIASVIEAAHAHGKWVGLCGELAGDPVAAPVLLGLGLDEWSMNPPAIALVKERVRTLSVDDCKVLARRCLAATSPEAVREILIED